MHLHLCLIVVSQQADSNSTKSKVKQITWDKNEHFADDLNNGSCIKGIQKVNGMDLVDADWFSWLASVSDQDIMQKSGKVYFIALQIHMEEWCSNFQEVQFIKNW